MQKAPVMKGSGLKPLEETKPNEEVHVFGRNLEERVLAKVDEEESPSISFNIPTNSQSPDEEAIDFIRKRKFDAITGEENEETIFQGDFKLFVWDLATSNWIEKGRGQLKLNDSTDSEQKKSRLIMRISGTLRIILNVAISRSFFKVIANSKTNIRFTDSQTVWAASGSNAHQLKEFIDERLNSADLEEESLELRKRTKSDVDEDLPSKKTKADTDKAEESSEPPANESGPSQKKDDSQKNDHSYKDNDDEVDGGEAENEEEGEPEEESVDQNSDLQAHQTDNTGDHDDDGNDSKQSDQQSQEEQHKAVEEVTESQVIENGKSNGETKLFEVEKEER